MRKYTYEEFLDDVNTIAKDIQKETKPEAILAVARGGMMLGLFLAKALDMRELYALNSIHYEETKKLDTIHVFNIPDLTNVTNVLIVDDIIDSGETMIEIKRVLKEKFPHTCLKVATAFYKEKALLRPEYSAREAKEWINFFWDFEIDNYKN